MFRSAALDGAKLDNVSFLIHRGRTFEITATGHEPVRAWLKKLPETERKLIGTDIKTVQFVWPIGKPLVAALGSGLWEVRTNLPNCIARVIFIVPREIIVLPHGFIKKERQTPKTEIALAQRRRREYLEKQPQ